MKTQTLLLPLLLVVNAAAQPDLLSTILSDAQSIYTAVTSALAPTTTSSSVAASTTSSSSSTSSTSSSSTSSTSTSSSSTPTSTSVAAAQSSAVSGGSGGSSNLLPIVLGCTLGALALAAFLGLLYLCLRRRKRSKTFAKHRPVSPDEEEIQSWRHEKPRVRSLKGPLTHTTSIGTHPTHAPLMGQYGGDPYNRYEHQNPFVPVPPPARRSMGSRVDLHNTEYSAHPYSPDHVQSYDANNMDVLYHDSSNHHTLAAGLGGAALGGLAAHSKDKHERRRSASRRRSNVGEKTSPNYSEDEYNILPQATANDRRSGSVSRASAKEPWPYMDAHGRRSMDSAVSGRRSFNKSQENFVTPDQHPLNQYSTDSYAMPSTLGLVSGATAGGLLGAAISAKRQSHSPRRKGILKQTTSDSSNPSSLSDGSRTGYSVNKVGPAAHNTGPHELASADVPPTPVTRGRRDSSLGTAAPLAAAAAFTSSRQNRRRSGSQPRSAPRAPSPSSMPVAYDHVTLPGTHEHGSHRPIMPSRSPKRTSLDSRARYSSANEGTVELPVGLPKQDSISPPLEAQYAHERDGLISPVSPIGGSQPGSWSRAQAEELGMNQAVMGGVVPNQDRTAADVPHTGQLPSDHSDNHSSGLISAIQRIFSSHKPTSSDEHSVAQPLTTHMYQSRPDYDDTYQQSTNIQHRTPIPTESSRQQNVGELRKSNDTPSTVDMPGTFMSEQPTIPQLPPRNSGDSLRSMPPRYSSRGYNADNTNSTDFAPTVPMMNTTRPRSSSRPGYGPGSGDPFDLARVRTDSSTTGASLSNHIGSAGNRPVYPNAPQDKHEGPTLADLRREVQDEERERIRKSKEWRQSGSGSKGLRYGDDRELFDLVDQTTGAADHNRLYGQGGLDTRTSATSVGKAY